MLKNLFETQKPNVLKSYEHIKTEFSPPLQNLTAINFTNDETSLLNKAIKYDINFDEKKKINEEDLIDFQAAIRMRDPNFEFDTYDSFYYFFF